MKLWRVIPLFALAQASCYDYEYYDPDTGSSIPGNACAKQQATAAAGTSIGQPLTSTTSATTFGSAPVATSYAPVATFSSAPATTTYPSASFASGTVPAYSGTLSTSFAAPVAAPAFGTTSVATTYPVAGAAVYTTGATAVTYPVATTVAAPVYAPATVATSYPVAATTVTAVAPAAITVATPRSAAVASTNRASSGANSQQQAELQYYQNLAQRQARQHQENARVVQQASQDLSRASLINSFSRGSSFYPIVRLANQKQAADAYKSEKRIAEKNADDAYQRYQQDPSRLNLLVSKYQDLNADLRGAAYQYNVVNSGTFGQSLARSSLFGVSGNIFNTITQVVTQRQQSEDLQDIQRQMQRVQRQIVSTVQAQAQQSRSSSASGSATVAAPSGSVQQRMMALSVYGPQQQRG